MPRKSDNASIPPFNAANTTGVPLMRTCDASSRNQLRHVDNVSDSQYTNAFDSIPGGAVHLFFFAGLLVMP
jgi:hypothetical protein